MMDHKGFKELHTKCAAAFDEYVSCAEVTSEMLSHCTADPLPLDNRLQILLQEQSEYHAHVIYLSFKQILHEAARLGYENSVSVR